MRTSLRFFAVRRTVPLVVAAVCLTAAAIPAAGFAQAASSTRSGSAATSSAPAAVIPEVASGAARALGLYPPTARLRVVVGLKTPHPAAEEAFLAALQDKKSPLYHQFLTQAEWTKRFGPSPSAESAVVQWATKAGLTVAERYPNRLIVDLTGSVAQLQHAFGVTEKTYLLSGNTFFANDRTPALPSSIASVVQSIGGLDSLHRMATAAGKAPVTADYSAGPVSSAGGSAGANGSRTALAAAQKVSAAKLSKASGRIHTVPGITNGFYDPTDIYSSTAYDVNALYAQGHCCNPNGNSGGTPAETSIAIATIGGHSFSDYAGFHAQYPYLAYHVFEHNIDGTPTCCDGEGTMDMEWSTAWSNSFGSFNDTSSINMYDGATNFQSTFTDEYNHMVSDNSARVMSTSWSCAEHQGPHFPCDNNTRITQHSIFDNMIGMGWSLVASSGDAGAFGDCQSKGVEFPASDPDVVAAGGTTLFTGTVFNSETGWAGSTSPGSCVNNNGGSTGGCSIDYAAPSYQGSGLPCGSGSRSVPDVALNASIGQNIFLNGALQPGGGTSIVAPEIAGFLAQKNAYGLFMGDICGLGTGTSPCAPLGQANPTIYLAMQGIAPHKAAYDILSGCNSNDIGPGFCAGPGYDLVTGWGSFNALQLAWGMNYRTVAENSPPVVTFSGPTTGTYFNTDQTVFWSALDLNGTFPASGTAGYTSGWDSIPPDPFTHATPGSGDSFYSGPASVAATGGALNVSAAGQGCHTVNVQAWDNMGLSSGDRTYGPVCYDTVAPTVTGPLPRLGVRAHLTPSGVPVLMAWTGSDATSGVASYHVYKKVDAGGFASVGTFTSPSATFTLLPGHTYQFEVNAIDRAGNTSSTVVGRSFKVNLAQETATNVVYTGAWTLASLTGSSGGKVKYSFAASTTAKLSFNGFAVAWVTTLGSTHGSATVSLDGHPATTVNTVGGTTVQPAMTIYTTGAPGGNHTLLIKNLATSGHPRIDVDAFVILQ